MNNMSNTEFTRYTNDLVNNALDIMGAANQEYASEEGRFDNFIAIAEFFRRTNPRLSQITPQDVAWIYRLKHMISVIKGVSIREDLSGRIMDDINYGLLISGMWEADKKAELA